MKNIQIDGTEIFYFYIDSKKVDFDFYYKMLSIDEKEKCNKYYFKKDSVRFTICRGILRELLGPILSLKPENLIFDYNSYGKPRVSDSQNIKSVEFNISHSENLGIIAISKNAEVGIDIEKITDIEDYLSIAKRSFSDDDYKLLHNCSKEKSIKNFYKIWSHKEAVIKASGQGLSFGLGHWSVKLGISGYNLKIRQSNFRVIPLSIDPNYTSALSIVMN